jgi:hypothetical protein
MKLERIPELPRVKSSSQRRTRVAGPPGRPEFLLAAFECRGNSAPVRIKGATSEHNEKKADPTNKDMPIIAVTSYALSGDEQTARATGCDDYVPKPFGPRQLLAKIRQYLASGLRAALWSNPV